ncbi:MAG: hypothetical protein ACTHJO_14430 [Rhodanobacter sp.]
MAVKLEVQTRLRFALLVFLMLVSSAAAAADYDLSVTRKGSNLYKVDGKDIYIHTRYCYEYVYNEDSLLRMSGTSGKIVFIDEGASCEVKAVYGDSGASPGKYKVSVSRADDDWYEVFGADTFIKTSACLSLSLGDDAILNLSGPGYGSLYFIDDDEDCMVEGVYSKLRL